MAADHGNRLRLVVPMVGAVKPGERPSPLVREAFETTDLVEYARRLWNTPHDRIRFLVQLPDSRRWLSVSLTATYAGAEPVTLLEAEVTPPPHGLTPRELVVLTLLAAGHSTPAIAEYLVTSPRTVSTQVETIRSKLGASSRTAASVLAVQNGWVVLPVPTPDEALGNLDIAGLVRPAEAARARRETGQRLAPIRIGLVYPAQGLASNDGEQSRNGALLAIEELNSRGGVRGRRIDPVIVDADIYTVDGIRATFATLAEKHVQGVLMSFVLEEEAAFEEAAQLGVPVLHTMTSKRHLEVLGGDPGRYRNLFQCAPPETNYGTGFVRFLDLLGEVPGLPSGQRSVLFVETTVDSGQVADPSTVAAAEARGWSVRGIEQLSTDPAATHELVDRIIEDPPTVLMVTEFFAPVLADLLVRLRQGGCPSIVYTVYAPSVPEFVERAGSAAEDLVWATVSGTYPDPFGTRFASAFEKRFGDLPGLSQAGLAYDMAQILANAWQHTTDPSDVDGVLAALRSTRYRGVNGSYTFSAMQSAIAYPDETSDPSVGNAHLIFQVQNGQHRCVAPEPYSNAKLELPPLH